MQVILDGSLSTGESVLALGMFDGVHLGHRVLLQKAKALADQCGAPLVACTFITHPMSVIAPQKCPPMLTTLDERARLMEGLGVDILYAQPFTPKTMETAPERFVGDLCARFHPLHIVIGYNYSFGKNGEGTPLLLAAFGDPFGYQAHVVPRITLDGRDVSSTAIRAAISEGRMGEAMRLLGHPYSREFSVQCREGLRLQGKLLPSELLNPPKGRYRTLLISGEKTLPITVCMSADGEATLRLPVEADIGADLRISFLARSADA